jgi:multidrug efflux pump subunit AcrA (membrane-fusion protein)
VRSLLLALGALATAACSHAIDDHQLVDVTRDDLVLGVDVVGELEAVDSTDIKPPALRDVWDFKIASLAAEGSDVKAGDPVIGFDASAQVRALENTRNEADAADKALAKKRDDAALARRDDELKLAEAEAALHKAQLKADTPPDLVASVEQQQIQLDAEVAQLALDAARQHAAATKESDEAELKRLAEKAAYAKHRVGELEHDIAGMQVTAPRGGTIVYPNRGGQDKHKVGDTVWRMEDVVQVVGLGAMVGAGQVDEVDSARVAEQLAVTLKLDALPDVRLHGTVKSIAKTVSAKSHTDPSKVVKLKIALAPATVPLRPGMRFRGEIETEKLPQVVQVPAEAVFVTADGPVAYRDVGGTLERVALVLGRRTARAIEVKSGLSPGDRVSRVDPEATW